MRQNQTVIHQTSQCVGQEARCVAWLFGQHLFLAPFNVRSFCACSKVCWGIKIPGEKGYFLLEYSQLRCADCWNNSNICTRTRKHTQERIGHIWPLALQIRSYLQIYEDYQKHLCRRELCVSRQCSNQNANGGCAAGT